MADIWNKTEIIATTEKYDDEDSCYDEEQEMIRVLVLGLRTLSEVRYMCLQSNENFRTAAELQKKADRKHCEAKRHKDRYRLRNTSIDRLLENIHRKRGLSHERIAQKCVRIAMDELKTAYSIMNSHKNVALFKSTTRTAPPTTDDYAIPIRFLRARYHRPMTHIGAGLLPPIDDPDRFLGQTISYRQAKLLTDVIAQLEEDLERTHIVWDDQSHLRHDVPWLDSPGTIHRGIGI